MAFLTAKTNGPPFALAAEPGSHPAWHPPEQCRGRCAGYYLKLILIGFIPSVPIAYLFGKEWLQNFAEQTPIYWWIFVVSFVSVSIIVLLTVIVQSWRVANDNPINSIKTE